VKSAVALPARCSQFDARCGCIAEFGQQPSESFDRVLVPVPGFDLHRGMGQQLSNSGDAQLQDALEQLSSFGQGCNSTVASLASKSGHAPGH
jgi:hypothetical protein